MSQKIESIRGLKKRLSEIERERDELREKLEKTKMRFRKLYEGSRDGYAFVDMSGCIVESNSAFQEMLGYTGEQLKHKTYENITLKKWHKIEKRILEEQVFTRGYSDIYEKEYRRKDGKRIPVEIRTYLALEGNNPIGMWAFVRDISERKKVERSLAESEERYRNLIELAPDCIFVSDLKGKILAVNTAIQSLTGFVKEEIEGKHFTKLPTVHFSDIPSFVKIFKAIIEGKPVKNVSFKFKRKDGTSRWGEADIGLIKVESKTVGVQAVIKDITERKEIEEALQESKEKYRCVVENAKEAIVVAQDGILKFVNPRTLEITGYSESELLSLSFIEFIHPDDRSMVLENYKKRLQGEKVPEVYSFRMVTKEGKTRWLQISAVLISWDNRPASLNFLTDITEIKSAEEELKDKERQLLQVQKMEAIGRLAGGVAHDFNNLLTAIIGYTDILLLHPKLEQELKKYVEQIKNSSDRASSLIQQLLAFSRRQMMQAKTFDLNKLVANIDKMLRRLIGEDIELFTVFEKDLGLIKADPGQIEQVIMNLAVNARDAMPTGGKLIIETKNIKLDQAYFENRVNGQPELYIMLCVTDTGIGMDEETKRHIFEPFFTTKEIGRGTGLGLSTVYGIVKQSGGYIWVYSEPDKGTTFKCYFPRVDDAILEQESKQEKSLMQGGRETILLVEDEFIVRNLISNILKHYGYTVIESENGEKALEVRAQCSEQPVDMLITDVVMPGISGRVLADRLQSVYPEMKVLYISGYTDDAIVRHGVLDHGIPFLQKPFAPKDLAKKVREILDNG
jgi:two-component system cell cycle sensor histidine kinase/response regulator CckA